MLLEWEGRLARLAAGAMERTRTRNELSQLRTAATLDAIRPEGLPLPSFTFIDAVVSDTIYLARLAEVQRSARERRRNPGALATIAAAFEDLAHRTAAGSAQRRDLLAQAASMWSVAGFQANCAVLAEELTKEIEAVGDNSVPTRLATLVAAVLLRDLAFAERVGQEAVSDTPQLADSLLGEANGDTVALADAAVLAAYALLGRAAINAVQFWRRGEEGAPGAAARAIEAADQAAHLLLHANVVDTWMLADNMRLVLQDAFAASLWRGLRGRAPTWNNLWRRYIRLLAEDDRPVVEIWPSQRRALEAGLLDSAQGSLVARMPTSAGKTRMAEFAILAALGVHPGEYLAAYVVPTRALAAEVERRLSQSLGAVGFRVSALFGGLENVDYELALVENTDILIVTPEKLDLLLRQDNDMAARLSLAIIDEGHLLADLERGLRLELLMTRLRRRVANCRLLLLSAVIPNVEEIGTWLDPAAGGGNALEVMWSPSRLATGVFFWQGRARDGQFGRVRYSSHDEKFFVPYVLRRRTLRTALYPHSKSQAAAELALHYQRMGPVIVGAATKPTARGVARALSEALRRRRRDGEPVSLVDPAKAGDIDRLRLTVRDTVGEDHELAEYIAQGFAYHHADIPEELRVAIERAFRGGALRILVATSTLSQGVNLPAKTVIVSHTYRGQDEQIPVSEFWNLAGRAGRALEETEGHVIVLADNESEARGLQRRYLDPAKVERVHSVLYRLYAAIVRNRFPGRQVAQLEPEIDLGEHPLASGQTQLDALDVQLIALAAEEMVDTEDEAAIENLLGHTLCGVQLARDGVSAEPFRRYLARRFTALKARVPDQLQRRSYYRAGLSLRGCEVLLGEIDRILGTDDSVTDPNHFGELRQQLLEACAVVPEVLKSCREHRLPPSALAGLAADWIDGTALHKLRTAHGPALEDADAMEFSAAIERVVVRDLPWILSSAIEFIGLRRGESWRPYAELSALPAMAKFGVATVEACYAASVGLRRREVAQSVGKRFAAGGGGSFTEFLHWLSSLAPEQLADLSDGVDVASLVQRVAVLAGSRESLSLLASGAGVVRAEVRGVGHEDRWRHLVSLPLPSRVELKREAGNPYDPNAILVLDPAGSVLGYVAREVARAVAPLMDMGAIAEAELITRTSADPGRIGSAQVRIALRSRSD